MHWHTSVRHNDAETPICGATFRLRSDAVEWYGTQVGILQSRGYRHHPTHDGPTAILLHPAIGNTARVGMRVCRGVACGAEGVP